MPLDAIRLRAALPGVAIHVLDTVDSTQRLAAEWTQRHRWQAPALLTSHRQTAGRGRGGHVWLSDPGSLALTLARPIPPDLSPLQLPLRAGLAVRDALGAWIDPQRIAIKWPNDVLVDGRKIAGLLCQRHLQMDLIGIGLNVGTDLARLDPALVPRAISLQAALGTEAPCPDRTTVLIHVAEALLWLEDREPWHAALCAAHALTGRSIRVETGDGSLAGLCEGIDAEGRLLLRCGSTLHRLLDGSIERW